MEPKKPTESGKRKREVILLEVKQDIIRKYDQGMRVVELAREYGRNASTIVAILKDKERIMGREPAKGVTVLTKNRPAVIDEIEKLLLKWIREKERAGDTVTSAVVCDKARALHADLIAQQPGISHKEFKASRGWFEKFKMRSGICSVVRHGEAANSAELAEAEEFATEFFETMTAEGYLPEQAFNCGQTSLFWKRMPRRTFVAREETKMTGHEPMEDRLGLLLCANARDDLKEHSTQEGAVMEIDSLGHTRVLKLSTQDVEDLVEGQNLELSSEDLLRLQEQEQQGVQPDTPEEREEEPRQLPSSSYKRACELWDELQTFVNDLSEDQAAAQEAAEHFDSAVVAPWRAVLRKRQREQTMDRFVVKQEDEPCCSSQLSPSASSSQK